MAKLTAEPTDADALASFLHHRGFSHLRVRRRGDLLTIETGPDDHPYPRARLRRVGAQSWRLEMATHNGRWELTPFHGRRDEVQRLLVDDFPWTIAALE